MDSSYSMEELIIFWELIVTLSSMSDDTFPGITME